MSLHETGKGCRVPSLLAGVVRILLATALLVVLVLMAFFAEGMDYSCRKTFLVSNAALILLCLVILTGLAWMLLNRAGIKLRHAIAFLGGRLDVLIFLLTVTLFLVQVRLCWSYAFETGWDSGMLANSAWTLARGGELEGWPLTYFSMYPNNLFLLWVASQCMRLSMLLGAGSVLGGVLIFSVLNCASVGLAAWLTYRYISAVSSRAWGLLAWLLCVLLVWTSPWAGILYSDCVVVFVPAAVLLCFVRSLQNDGLRRAGWWALIGFFSIIGYKIKPQVVFPLLAVVLFVAGRTLWRVSQAHGRFGCLDVAGGVQAVMALGLGCVVAFGLVSATTKSLDVPLDESAQFGPAHFLMMGLNDETGGVYLESDVSYSRSFLDQESRTRGDLLVVGKRLRTYGPQGFARLMADKLMTNFADGTFAWGLEGNFFNESTTANVDGVLSRATRSLYYPDGSRLSLFETYAHTVWILVLVCCALACVLPAGWRKGRMRELLIVATMSLLMLIAFELLFEARARYIFSSLTVFIGLAALGMRSLCWSLGAFRARFREGAKPARHLAVRK